jgi:hypothetical protein
MSVFFFLISLTISLQAAIRVDQFGYPAGESKTAILKIPVTGQDTEAWQEEPGDSFHVRCLSGDTLVYTGAPAPWKNGAEHEQSGDRVWHLDFSEVTQSGIYRIEEPHSGRQSPSFEIRENPWKAVLRAAGRTYFYQRIGIEKPARHAGDNWADAPAFLQDSVAMDYFDQDNPEGIRDLRGGWFDAGDYNKYVTFLESVIHELMAAYRLYPDVWSDDWNIPESGNGLPDLLDEVKWELDWLMRMQNEDGSVIIKMGDIDHNSATPPGTDTRPRYYGKVSTAAAISLASMASHAALIYSNFSPWESFADTLESAARRSWEWYSSRDEKDTDVDQGEIKAGDADRTEEEQRNEEAVFGAYMFALTGEQQWHDLFLNRYEDVPFMQWRGPYRSYMGEALLYYANLPDADAAAAGEIIQTGKEETAPFYGSMVETDPWYAGMPDEQYHWGSISVMSRTGILNLNQAEYLDTDRSEHRQRARDILHYIHGKNPLGKCYMSNMAGYGAENSVDEFFHSWFAHGSYWQNVQFSEKGGPAPGFIVGGPNKNYAGSDHLPAGLPPQKMYADFNNGWPDDSWEVTENSISYQAAYMRLLAAFVTQSSDTLGADGETGIQDHTLNGSGDQNQNTAPYTLYDVRGRTIMQGVGLPAQQTRNRLPRGIYFIHREEAGIRYKVVVP